MSRYRFALCRLATCSMLLIFAACTTPVEYPVVGESDLPRASSRGPTEWTVTRAQLLGGIEIEFEVTVPAAARTLRAVPLDMAGCDRADENGLIVFPVVRRDGETVFCPGCDLGYCQAGPVAKAPAVRTGTHRYVFRWHGETGRGPSHFAYSTLDPQKQQEIVPPGDYEVTFTTAFASVGAERAARPRTSETKTTVRVVP